MGHCAISRLPEKRPHEASLTVCIKYVTKTVNDLYGLAVGKRVQVIEIANFRIFGTATLYFAITGLLNETTELSRNCDKFLKTCSWEMKLSVGAHGTYGIGDVSESGVSSIEPCALADDECIDLMVKNYVMAVPTPLTFQNVAAHGAELGCPASIVEKAAWPAPQHERSISKIYKAGIECLFGSDSGTPLLKHGEQHGEFQCMVKAGISPIDRLPVATRRCAEFMGWNDRPGTLEEGKLADIVAINGDPLKDMRDMDKKSMNFVMKEGVIYKKDDLPVVR